MKKIGFIGLGIMGKPMAKNLLKHECSLFVFDLVSEAVEEVVQCGAASASLAEIGQQCDLIFTMLPNGAIVSDVLFSKDGVCSQIRSGSLIVDLSSVTPNESRKFSQALEPYGVHFMDAPVSGGEPKAIDGTLAFMVGGSDTDFITVQPYLDKMGASCQLVGNVGSGSVAKLTNQVIVNLTIAAVSEAFVLAAKAGADPQKVYHAIRQGLAGSNVLDAKIPMILARNFQPGGKISINHKDIKNVLATAHEINVPVPFSAQLFEVLQTLKVQGHENDDHAGIVQYFETLANVQVTSAAAGRAQECVSSTPEQEILDLTVLKSLPPAHYDERILDKLLAAEQAALKKKIIVLDDDPTGVQTVHDTSVYTNWQEDSLRAGFAETNKLFFVLTNSRAMTAAETKKIHQDIAQRLCIISQEKQQDFIVISRSDSTLRGHYPLETATLREEIQAACGISYDGEIIVPFFEEGGRYTFNNIHYVKENSKLYPAGLTEFAKDKSFGYTSSDLPAWVEEKTAGAYPSDKTICIDLESLRNFDIDYICDQLCSAQDFQKIIVNATQNNDIKVFVIAFLRALHKGKNFLFRSAAAIPKILGGVSDRPLLTKKELITKENKNGGLILIGSHVQKTTNQLTALKECPYPIEFIEFNQHLVTQQGGLAAEVERVVCLANKHIAAGKTVAVYTRRERFDLNTDDKELQLKVSVAISDAVTSIVSRLTVRPNFIIAKGGITSSDVGTKALHVKRATVAGQIQPGVPVWLTGEESKFPHLPYIIFPGNVGEVDTLRTITEMLMKADE